MADGNHLVPVLPLLLKLDRNGINDRFSNDGQFSSGAEAQKHLLDALASQLKQYEEISQDNYIVKSDTVNLFKAAQKNLSAIDLTGNGPNNTSEDSMYVMNIAMAHEQLSLSGAEPFRGQSDILNELNGMSASRSSAPKKEDLIDEMLGRAFQNPVTETMAERIARIQAGDEPGPKSPPEDVLDPRNSVGAVLEIYTGKEDLGRPKTNAELALDALLENGPPTKTKNSTVQEGDLGGLCSPAHPCPEQEQSSSKER